MFNRRRCSKMYVMGWIAVVCLFLSGWANAAGQDLLKLDLKNRERAVCQKIWRDAYRITPQNGSILFDLGVPVSDSVLRLGMLPPASGAIVKINLLLDDQIFFSAQTKSPQAWFDRRFPLPPEGTAKAFRIRFECPEPFWISTLESIVPKDQDKANVLIVLVDTLRQDHLGLYGYSRPTSPCIDAFAKDAVVFSRMTPQCSWTRPSVASLLTGVYPSTHGAQDLTDVLRAGLPSLALSLQKQGLETAAILNNDNCLPTMGFGADFECYDFAQSVRNDGDFVDQALKTIRHKSGRPWFLYLHLMGPHGPYHPPDPKDYTRFQPDSFDQLQKTLVQAPKTEPFDQIRQVLGMNNISPAPAAAEPESESQSLSIETLRQRCIDLYDGEITFTDAQIGRLFDGLKEMNAYENTLIIFTADHGEEFWEHGNYRHGNSLFEELIRVPFLVKMPHGEAAGTQRMGTINMVDVAPTILEVLGAPPDSGFQGKSFLPLLLKNEDDGRFAFASLTNTKSAYHLRMTKRDNAKFIQNLKTQAESWYDLAVDPGERQPLATPPDNADQIRKYNQELGSLGAAGLYILVMGDSAQAHRVSGVCSAPGLGNFSITYPAARAKSSKPDADTANFDIEMAPAKDSSDELSKYPGALLHAPVEAGAEIRIAMQMDGKDLTDQQVFLGKDKRSATLAAAINPQEIIAGTGDIQPGALPPQFAVYIWYTPEPTQLVLDKLDSEIQENLEALGYLGK